VSQALLFVAMHLVGLAICLAVGPRTRPALCAALGFPIGLAAFVLAALVLLVLHAPYTPLAVIVAVALIAAGAAYVAIRRGIAPADARMLAVWTAVFFAAAAVLTYRNVVISTWDSHGLVMVSRIIVEDDGLSAQTLLRLHKWGVFQIAAQTLSDLTSQDFLYGLPVVFGASFVPVFAITLWHGLATTTARVRRLAVVAATVAFFTIPMVGYHVLYLHTNFASAIYLFAFVVLFWLAETESDASYLPVAFICLTAFALQRTENPLLAVVFLCLTLAPSTLPRRPVLPWLGGFVVVTAAWYLVLAQHAPEEGTFLSPLRCRVIAAALAGAFAWWAVSPAYRWMRWIDARLPLAVAAAVALALVAAFATSTDHMLASLDVTIENLRTVPYWGHSWYGLAALAVASLALPAPPFRQAFAIGVPVFLGAVLLMAYSGPGYRLGNGDSANRMIINAVPLIVFYVALKAAPRLEARG
jgi:hypothetical protein